MEKNISSPPSTQESSAQSSPESTPPLRPSSVSSTSPEIRYKEYQEYRIKIGPIKKIEFVEQ